MTTKQKTLAEALEAIGLTTSSPTTAEMTRALVEAADKLLYSRSAIEINAKSDVNIFKKKFSDGELSLLDPAREAEMLRQKAAEWRKLAKDRAEGVEDARKAIAAHLERLTARQRELPSEAAKVANGDKTQSLLARLVDGQERAEAAQFVRERSAADVLTRYANASDTEDASFVRYVEAASAGQYLQLTGDPADVAGAVVTLREQIRERREARIGQDERDALAVLPKVAADVARNLAEIAPDERSIGNVLKVAGQPGTRPNPRLVAQEARLAAETAGAGA